MRSRLSTLIGELRSRYGRPKPPPARSAFELVVWEKVAYLATDEKRASAFEALRRKVGLAPKKILAARRGELIDILATGGIGAAERAENLVKAAEMAVGDFDVTLDAICRRPLPEAKKQLMRIRGIGEPGAEKILLFARSHPVLGLDSNALRVLTRLGYGAEAKSYTATYRSATSAALPELGSDIEVLIEANLLLREHGQTVCKTSNPHCGTCGIRSNCPSRRDAT